MGKSENAKNTESPDPQKVFTSTMLGMSWQMAVAVLVPTFLGIQADKHFDTKPYITLACLLLATVLVVIIVRQAVKNLNSYMMHMPSTKTPEEITKANKEYDDLDD
jgi:F0F1-type ATP synthase assembly protein I